jgi:signal transduction histidine kinase
MDLDALTPLKDALAGGVIEVLQGPDAGALHLIGTESALLGRGDEADLQLSDTKVSRNHCRIGFEQGGFWLRDLGSSNGTHIGRRAIEGKVKLPDRCSFHVGRRTVVEFSAVDAEGLQRAFDRIHLSEHLSNQRRYSRVLARQTEELHAALADLEQLARAATRELMEPLGAIDRQIELMDDARGDDAGLDEIGYSVERMRRQLQDLHTYARLGAVVDTSGLVRLDDALDAALERLGPTLMLGDASVDRQPLPTVVGDPTHLCEVFVQLVGHTARLSTNAAPCIRVTAEDEDGEWVFSVTDDGAELAVEDMHRIFEVFAQVHSQEDPQSSGVGMAVARRVVQLHGGRIWVESGTGDGTSFCFTLPIWEGSGRADATLDPDVSMD